MPGQRSVVLVVVTVMYMTVLDFFRSRIAHTDDFHVEMQCLAGHRMIAVDSDLVTVNRCHHYVLWPAWPFSGKAHARLDLVDSLEHFSGKHLDQLGRTFTVGLGWRDCRLETLAGAFTFQFFLQARDQIVGTTQIEQWTTLR